jgi:hypothetical protein
VADVLPAGCSKEIQNLHKALPLLHVLGQSVHQDMLYDNGWDPDACKKLHIASMTGCTLATVEKGLCVRYNKQNTCRVNIIRQ